MIGGVRRWLLWVALAMLAAPLPAWAEVRLTFWSRDTSNYFPHAFVTLKGTLDATGEPVDISYGFTLDNISPVALFSAVPAHVDITHKRYIAASDAQFQVTITDDQVRAIRAQAAEWDAPKSRWKLNSRNCVHFVAEVARRAGLMVEEPRRLMKKPKSFTRSLIPLNPGRVTVIDLKGSEWWAKAPAEEVFGVPADNKASVLERRMSRAARKAMDAQQADPAPSPQP
jgi:hypothetical protein